MKFVYEYRTSDNVPHKGVVAAANREAAFAALKAQGIRPGFLGEAPGFFNKLFGKGKRWLAILVLGALCVVLGSYYFRASKLSDFQTSEVRRQLIGDTAVIEKGIRTGWSDVFALEGDQFLASFAIPGVPAAVRNTTEAELKRALDSTSSTSSASLEGRQIVAIVAGMKKEINALLASGWTLRDVGAALAKRQDREVAIYQRVGNEIEQAKKENLAESDLIALWEKKNAELRNLGIKLIPMPE